MRDVHQDGLGAAAALHGHSFAPMEAVKVLEAAEVFMSRCCRSPYREDLKDSPAA